MLLQGECPFKVYEMPKHDSDFISKTFSEEWKSLMQNQDPPHA